MSPGRKAYRVYIILKMYNEEGTIFSESNAYYRKTLLKIDTGTNWMKESLCSKEKWLTIHTHTFPP